MNYFKTKVRNRMSLNKVNSLLHIKYGLKIKNLCCEGYLIPSNVSSKVSSNITYTKSNYYIKTILWSEVVHNDEDEDIFFWKMF